MENAIKYNSRLVVKVYIQPTFFDFDITMRRSQHYLLYRFYLH